MQPPRKILLTSFSTWLPHQASNSSDDLLQEVSQRNFSPHSLVLLRQLPVETQQASQLVLAKIQDTQPDIVVCCGMAEKRNYLSLESTATQGNHALKSPCDLHSLVSGLDQVEVSHDAGKFVCEGLYYNILKHRHQTLQGNSCVFAHIPVLTRFNQAEVLTNFVEILTRMVKL